MRDLKELEKQLAARLSMSHRPVAIAFLDAPPAGCVTNFPNPHKIAQRP